MSASPPKGPKQRQTATADQPARSRPPNSKSSSKSSRSSSSAAPSTPEATQAAPQKRETAADRLKEDAKRRFKQASGQAALEQSFDQMTDQSQATTTAATAAAAIGGGRRSAPSPQSPQSPSGTESLERVETLLSFESEIRKAGSPAELNYLIVNESKSLIASDLVLLHKPNAKGRLKKVELISSLAIPDDNSPLLIWLNSQIDAAVAEKSVSNTPFDRAPIYIRLKAEDAPHGGGENGASFPFAYALYVPHYSSTNVLLSGITYLRRTPFEASDGVFAGRAGGTVAHAMQALRPRARSWPRLFTKPVMAVSTVLVAMAMFIPVTLTVLAPVEIVPDRPAIVASPLSGVIDMLHVQPNARVKKGQALFRLNKVELLNKFEVAERNVAVAEAKYRRATQGSFGSSESKRELTVTKAEFDMATAERDFAAARLAQSDVVAARDGIVLYSGAENWTGKPVVTGERIMRIADPANIKMRIEVETGDAIIMGKGSGVNAFFDSDPLTPVAGVLETQSYQAETTDTNILVFPMIAAISGEQVIHQRIGLRGTAQIYGSEVPLWFFLFRKPISAVRQMIGM